MEEKRLIRPRRRSRRGTEPVVRDLRLQPQQESMFRRYARELSKITAMSFTACLALLKITNYFLWYYYMPSPSREARRVVDLSQDLSGLGRHTADSIAKDISRMVENNIIRSAACIRRLTTPERLESFPELSYGGALTQIGGSEAEQANRLGNAFQQLATELGSSVAKKLTKEATKLAQREWKQYEKAFLNNTVMMTIQSVWSKTRSPPSSIMDSQEKALIKQRVAEREIVAKNTPLEMELGDWDPEMYNKDYNAPELVAQEATCHLMDKIGLGHLKLGRVLPDCPSLQARGNTLGDQCPHTYADVRTIIDRHIPHAIERGMTRIEYASQDINTEYGRNFQGAQRFSVFSATLLMLLFFGCVLFQILWKGTASLRRGGRNLAHRFTFGSKSRRRSRKRSKSRRRSRKRSKSRRRSRSRRTTRKRSKSRRRSRRRSKSRRTTRKRSRSRKRSR